MPADKNVPTFISTMLHSATVTHLQHLSTKSYAQHVALATYYDAIVELVDAYAEAYQGRYGVITDYPTDRFHYTREPKQYVKSLLAFADTMRDSLPDDPELVNLFDSIVDEIDALKYKLETFT